MKRIVLLVTLVLASNFPLSAAEPKVQGVQVFGGFSLLNVGVVQGLGWQTGAEVKVHPNIGLVADFGGHYRFDANAVEYLFGMRFSTHGQRTRLFTHTLIGGVRLDGFGDAANGMALGIGGGMDVRTSGRVAVRVFQVDWIPSRFNGKWDNLTARIGFGLVLKSSR